MTKYLCTYENTEILLVMGDSNLMFVIYRVGHIRRVGSVSADGNQMRQSEARFLLCDYFNLFFISMIHRSPLAQMEEERREHVMKMKKMEAEMEQVFEMKVKEKKQKLKDSEAEVGVLLILKKQKFQISRNLF